MKYSKIEIIYTECQECRGKGETPTGHSTIIGAPCYGMCQTCEGTGYEMEMAPDNATETATRQAA